MDKLLVWKNESLSASFHTMHTGNWQSPIIPAYTSLAGRLPLTVSREKSRGLRLREDPLFQITALPGRVTIFVPPHANELFGSQPYSKQWSLEPTKLKSRNTRLLKRLFNYWESLCMWTSDKRIVQAGGASSSSTFQGIANSECALISRALRFFITRQHH